MVMVAGAIHPRALNTFAMSDANSLFVMCDGGDALAIHTWKQLVFAFH